MKKWFALLTLALCALTLAGCGGGAPEKKAAAPVKGRALVVYYSRADENSGVGYIEKGNTKILAEFIAKATDADMFEIVPAKPYPKQYKAATEAAKNGVALEITSRVGHNRTNGHVFATAKRFGCLCVVDSDSHSPGDIMSMTERVVVARGAGMSPAEAETVLSVKTLNRILGK